MPVHYTIDCYTPCEIRIYRMNYHFGFVEVQNGKELISGVLTNIEFILRRAQEVIVKI
jgi:hypothetical protein